MEAYSKDYFKRLARDIMFDISDEEAGELQYEFQDLLKQIKALDAIDTEHVEKWCIRLKRKHIIYVKMK